MKLKIEELTVEAFAPFGEVITQPARAQDAQGPGWMWRAAIAIMPSGTWI
jgi:ureidoglycolate hydrolase